jgi:hypothetical protein
MRTSLLDNLPDALAGVKTRPLFVMRLNSHMQLIGPTLGYIRRLAPYLAAPLKASGCRAKCSTAAMIGRRSAATAPSPWMSAWS